MGNLNSKKKSQDIYKTINLTRYDKFMFMNQINNNFMKHAKVCKINTTTLLGKVDINYKDYHTDDMLNFFNLACSGNSKLIIKININDNNKTTGGCIINIYIMESLDQDKMLMQTIRIDGKCMSLTCSINNYDSNIFIKNNWYGYWFDDNLCGEIRYSFI